MNLIEKYNTPGPRYTSYPAVPFWSETPGQDQWKDAVRFTFSNTNRREGISIYIHLPYCESLCTYCGCNTRITVNHAVEEPYIHAVLKEWSMYLELFEETPVIRELHLGGGTPTFFSAENLAQLVSAILESGHLAPDAELSFEAHPASTTEAHLDLLYKTGFRRISLGIQDFDPQVQDIINRRQSFDMVKQVTETARRIGYTSVNYDLIYGLPLQNRQSIMKTIGLVNQLQPDRIAFYSYAHVPWIKPGQRRYSEDDLPSGTEKRMLYETGRALLEDSGYAEIGMDHFALKTDPLYTAAGSGELHRNFMGYTTGQTQLLIGLGVSAISDTWYAFAQNQKTVEAYLVAVSENQFPLMRGHLLDREDLIIRQHILNLMCRFSTSWHEAYEQCEAVSEAVEKLREMEKDGLVKLELTRTEITPAGRAFLRNICMAFDARLHRKEIVQKTFSTTV
ncbi:MAG: oxygen-independent coproporphyrinogen III oxidase [Bacteroidetes bacterium]|nr:MAG: oxygen-independent coproporphyrinogen III oxidase [Bacteroidota bacterium]